MDSEDSEVNLVKKTCRELGITQKQLAEKIGVKPESLNSSISRRKISKQIIKSIEMLQYKRTRDAINQHCKKAISFEEILKSGQIPPINLQRELGNSWKRTKLIPEPDVWRLIIKSKMPEAEKVEEWIMEEVLQIGRAHV